MYALCIWRCEHAGFCAYLNVYSFIHSFIHPLLGIALVLHGLVLCGVPLGLLGLSRPPCLGIALTSLLCRAENSAVVKD